MGKVNVTEDDMADYIKIKDEYVKEDILVNLVSGDYKQMSFRYLSDMVEFLVDGVLHEPPTVNGKQLKMSVAELDERLGYDIQYTRVYDLLVEFAGKGGVLVARLLGDDHIGAGERTALTITEYIQTVVVRFYGNDTSKHEKIRAINREFTRNLTLTSNRLGGMSKEGKGLIDSFEFWGILGMSYLH